MIKNNIIKTCANFLIILPILWIFTGLFLLKHGDKPLVVLTLISAAISLLIYKTSVCKKNIKNPYLWLMFGLLFISIICESLHIYNPINFRSIAIITVLLCFLPFTLITNKTLSIIIFIATINSFIFVFWFSYINILDRSSWPINAIPYSTYICFIAITSLILFFSAKNNIIKYILLLCLCLNITTIIMTETRGALVALVPTLFSLIFYHSYKNKTIKRNALFSVIGLVIICGLSYPIIEQRINQTTTDITSIKSGNTDTSIGLRLDFWKAGFHLIKESPIIGYGTNYFQQLDKLANEHIIPQYAAAYKPLHFHNQFVDISVKCGLLGLLSLFALLIFPIIKLKNKTSNEALLIYSYTSILILAGLTDVPFFHKQLFIIFFIIIGIMYGKNKQKL
ncbi:O-antigen ligase family protein [Photobacterium carnosum]|uniref:O-antigen ligase family protein n=1 Tax=Photobacterium carnosum TaxID=2023717 RepID=UPI001E4E25D5|nr:O-antigen ligase family protein [Photobacterium carnosum]